MVSFLLRLFFFFLVIDVSDDEDEGCAFFIEAGGDDDEDIDAVTDIDGRRDDTRKRRQTLHDVRGVFMGNKAGERTECDVSGSG